MTPDTSFVVGVNPDRSCDVTPAPSNCAWDASPAITHAPIDPFILDTHEVTVARFRAFWADRARTADGGAPGATLRASPVRMPGAMIAWVQGGREPIARTASTPRCNWSPSESTPSRESHPINCVDWWTAMEFCVWDGGGDPSSPTTGRLPTELEWEYAARARETTDLGPGRSYPWGEAPLDPTCDRARWNAAACLGEDDARTRRVGSFAATGGFFDLAGNVAEWTADLYFPAAEGAGSQITRETCLRSSTPALTLCYNPARAHSIRSVRGGSWRDTGAAWLRSASRGYAAPRGMLSTIGFRCARSVAAPDGGM